jgi:ferric-dicitrate binding protein FerR (iron transport regulator)
MLLAVAGGAVLWRAVRTSHPAPGRATVTALQEYATARGQRTTVHLADGTQVLLAAETRLLVPRDFGRPGARREVQLEGQAHFTVTHDAARPFVVRTATSVTEDLGTTFAIRAYPAEPEVEVVLAEGRVAVQPAHGSPRSSARSVLVPGDLARIDAEGHLQTTHAVNLSRYLAWTTGSLVFEGVPFRQAALDIERWYDLDIRLADPALGARRISGTVAGESVDAVLGYLALVLNARYEVAGKTVTFSPR